MPAGCLPASSSTCSMPSLPLDAPYAASHLSLHARIPQSGNVGQERGKANAKAHAAVGVFLGICEIVQRLVAQIPWGHVVHLMDKVTDKSQRLWSFFVHVCTLDAEFHLDSLTVSTSFKEA